MRDEGVFLRHEPCEKCGSSDAKAIYSNGTAYCFSCETYYPTVDGGAGYRGKAVRMRNLLQGIEYRPLRARGISEETCRKYGYGYASYKGRTVQVAPYRKGNRIVAQHLRTADKEFLWLGDSKDVDLFGQHLWSAGGRRIVITEGEIDCLTVAQVFNLRWPVVSVPNGAQSAKKAIKRALEYLESFDEIVIAFDSDEPGQKAAEECAQLFTPGKVKIANWTPYKDPNEMLQAGKGSKIAEIIFQAPVYRPDGIVAGTELTLDQLLGEDKLPASYQVPYPELDRMLKGLRKAEITTITAGTGIGKSTLARELAYHLATHHGLRIGYVALEESVRKSAVGFMAIHLNVPMGDLLLDPTIVSEEDLKEAHRFLFEEDRFYFYDHFGSLESENLVSKIKYLTTGLGVDYVVLDHISIAVSGIEDGDERRIIDNLMTALRSLVENSGAGMILISHLRVPQGKSKPHEEGGRVTLNELRGSGSIKQLSDNIIAVERNQQADDPNVARLRVLKNRLFGVTGLADTLRYNPETGRLLTDDVPDEFLEGEDYEEDDDDDIPF